MPDFDNEIDGLLRRSLAAPVPRLPPDFSKALARQVNRTSERSSRYGRMVLAGYGVVSAAASVVVMRGQGLGWLPIAGMTLGPLVAVGAVLLARGNQTRVRE